MKVLLKSMYLSEYHMDLKSFSKIFPKFITSGSTLIQQGVTKPSTVIKVAEKGQKHFVFLLIDETYPILSFGYFSLQLFTNFFISFDFSLAFSINFLSSL